MCIESIFHIQNSFSGAISRSFWGCRYKVYFQHQKCEKMSITDSIPISFSDLNSPDSRKNSCNNEILCHFDFGSKVGVLVRKWGTIFRCDFKAFFVRQNARPTSWSWILLTYRFHVNFSWWNTHQNRIFRSSRNRHVIPKVMFPVIFWRSF